MSKLTVYEKNDIHLVWEDVRPLINRALEHSYTHGLGDIADGLFTGYMNLWVYGEFQAAMVTQVLEDHHGKFCLLLTLSGDNFDEYKQYLDVIEAWAKAEGCKEMRIYGRRGWLRKLPEFKEQYTLASKPLWQADQAK